MHTITQAVRHPRTQATGGNLNFICHLHQCVHHRAPHIAQNMPAPNIRTAPTPPAVQSAILLSLSDKKDLISEIRNHRTVTVSSVTATMPLNTHCGVVIYLHHSALMSKDQAGRRFICSARSQSKSSDYVGRQGNCPAPV